MKKLGVFILLMATSMASYGASNAYCRSYAKAGVIQHINNLKHNCGFTGLRWTPLYRGQFQWCLTVRRPIAENEKQIRSQRLQNNCGVAPFGNIAWSTVSYWQKNKVIGAAIEAVKTDDVHALEIFKGQKVNLTHDWEGNYGPPLYHAIDYQKPRSVRYLIRLDNPNRTANAGPNPLSNMLWDNQVNYRLLKFLLRKNTSPNGSGELNDDSAAPLYVAINVGDMRALKILLSNNADPNGFRNRSFLIEAITRGNVRAVKLLLHHGANVNMNAERELCSNINYPNARMPLDYANAGGNAVIISLLTQRGAQTGAACL